MRYPRKKAGLLVLACAYALVAAVILLRPGREQGRGRVTIRVAHWQLEGGVRQGFAAMIRRYEEINPRVHVIQVVAPDKFYAGWALTQLVGGDAPDILEYNKDFSGYVVQQYFAPIEDEILKPNPYNRGTGLEAVPWRDTFLDAMSSEDGFNRQLNQHFAVTLCQHSFRIVYNRTLLRAITGSDAPPATYRELQALYARVRAYQRTHPALRAALANSKDTVIGLTANIFDWTTSGMAARHDRRHTLGMSNVDLALEFLRGSWNFREPESMIGMRVLREFGRNSIPGFLQLNRDAALMDFVNGRALMVVAPSWESTSLRELCDFDLGAFRYPVPEQDDPVYGRMMLGPYSDGALITMLALYLNRNSPHRAEALDFMRFMTCREGDQIFSDVSGWLPAVVGAHAPSAFSRQFQPTYQGYSWDSDWFTLAGDDERQLIRSSHYLLYGPSGNPEKYADALDAGLEPRVVSDLVREEEQRMQNLDRQDGAAAALHTLAGNDSAPLDFLPARLEGRTRQIIAILPVAPHPGRGRQGAAAPSPAGPAGAAGDTGGRLTEAWQSLANYRPDLALRQFGLLPARGIGSRQAAFGYALSLVAQEQPIPGRLERAVSILSSLAGGANDDISCGALFFLGRIAENRRDQPDPAGALRYFGRLVAMHGASAWAQASIPRLAILLLYTPAGPPGSAERLAAAEALAPLALEPRAIAELHVVMADAVFFHRLPDLRALPHLVAAERTGALDGPTRADVLVQIGELSRLAGDNTAADRSYRAFLSGYPRDYRCYAVGRLLARAPGPP